jgi:hypothetical protein
MSVINTDQWESFMTELIQIEAITDKIYSIRGKRIMLDMDLAQLYGVDTKQPKRAVKRNIDRFPKDFMFELTKPYGA